MLGARRWYGRSFAPVSRTDYLTAKQHGCERPVDVHMHGESYEKKHRKRSGGSRVSNLVDRSVGIFAYKEGL